MALIFDIEFDLDQYVEAHNSLVPFVAGTDEPGHGFNVLRGYQATRQHPPPSTLADADFDLDRAIDRGDFFTFQRGFPKVERGDARWQGNVDHDTDVDNADLKT